MTTLLEPKTYLPSNDPDVDRLDQLLDDNGPATFALTIDGESIALPEELNAILTHVVVAMRAGKAITITPQSQSLTTQQAADLLGMSRPTLIKLIDAGEIPCTRTSNRRKLLLDDVLDFRRRRRGRQLAAIAETEDDLEDDVDPETMATYLRDARAARMQRTRR